MEYKVRSIRGGVPEEKANCSQRIVDRAHLENQSLEGHNTHIIIHLCDAVHRTKYNTKDLRRNLIVTATHNSLQMSFYSTHPRFRLALPLWRPPAGSSLSDRGSLPYRYLRYMATRRSGHCEASLWFVRIRGSRRRS